MLKQIKPKKLFLLTALWLALALSVFANFSGIFKHSDRYRVEAATSSTINFQARLLTSTGALVPDGFYNVEFKLYSASSGGAAQWTETYYDSNGVTAGNDNRVRVVNGYLSVYLGSLTSFPSINWDQQEWVSLNIGGTTQTATPTWDGEMSPRLALTAVPYAFRAAQLAKLTGANTSTLDFATQTGARSILLPDESGTLCIQSSTNCGFAAASGSGNYIQNGTSLQASSNFHISGDGTADTSLTTPLLQAPASTALTITGNAASTWSTSSGNLTLQAGSGTVSLGTSTALTSGGALTITGGSTLDLRSTTTSAISLDSGSTGAINIGTGANAKTITLGNGTGATSIVLNNGTGALNIGTNAIAHTITLGNGTGATSVVLNAGTGAVNIGSNAVAHATTVGSLTGTAATTIQSGTGNLSLQTQGTGTLGVGNNAVAQNLAIGNVTGATGITERVGTGNYSLDGVTNSTYAVGASTTTGTITIGGTAQTGNITLGSSSGTATVLIGNGAGASTVNIANATTAGSTVNIAGAATATGNTDTVNIATGNTAGTGAKTVHIADGTPAGTGANTVIIGSSANASAVTLTAGTGNINLQAGTIVGNATTQNLFNTVATTINFGGAATTALNIGPTGATGTSINLAGGSGATGCTVDGATGNLTCDGAITTNATSGNQGWWNRTGTTLSPTNSGDAITTSGALQGGTLSIASGTFAVNSNGAITAVTGITGSVTATTPSGTNLHTSLSLTASPSSAPVAQTDYQGFRITTGSSSANTNSNTRLFGASTNTTFSGTGTLGTSYGNYMQAGNTSSGTINQAYGGNGVILNSGNGTVGTGTGVIGIINNTGTGTITQARALDATIINNGGGALTNAYGLRVESPTNTGGSTIDSLYGIYIAPQTAATTNNYGLYFAGSGTTSANGITWNGDTNLYRSGSGELTTSGDLVIQGGDLTTNQTTFNLLNTTATTINFGGAASTAINIGPASTTAVNINLAGGGSDTGCTVAGATGNLTCSGAIATNATTGTQGWWTRSGTTLSPVNSGDNLTVSGTISSPGSGTNSEHFGASSSVSTYNGALAVGNGASVTGNAGTAIGTSSTASIASTSIGNGATSNGNNSVAVGYTASAANGSSIAIGRAATTTASNQLVIGANSYAIQNVYIGNGVTNASPTGFTLQATGGSGSNIAGASIGIAGGQGTGTGNGGDINFQIAKPGSTGSSLNALDTIASFSGVNGAALFKNSVDSTTAFQIQDATGTSNFLTVNTSSGSVITSKLFIDTLGSSGLTSLCLNGSSQVSTCSGGGSGVTAVGTLDSQTKSSDGAVISGTSIYLQTADASAPGLVSTGTQTFAGDKTFTGDVQIQGGDLTTNQTTFNLLNATATTINFGGGASTAINIGPASTTATSINLAGGSADTGCTVAGATGNLTCSGAISTTATTGTQGWWSRSGTTLSAANSGDSVRVHSTGGSQFFTIQSAATSVYLDARNSAASDWVLVTKLATGDTQQRYILKTSGEMQWGSGTATQDIILSRSGAGNLLLQSLSNGANAFEIQNSSNATLLNFDASVASGHLEIGNDSGGPDKLELYRADDSTENAIRLTTAGTGTLAGIDWKIYQGTGNSNLRFWNDNLNTDVATLTTAGQLQLSVQGNTGGLLIGGDATLYRGGTNLLQSGSGLTLAGLLTGTAGATISGAATSINASSNFATNINTGTSTGAVSIGNSVAGAISLQSASTIGLTSGTTLSLTSTGANAININPGGTSNTGVLVKPGTNSTAAFRIQNAGASLNLFTANTTNSNITILGDLVVDQGGGNNGDILLHNGDITNVNGFNLVVQTSDGLNLQTAAGTFGHFGYTNGEALFQNLNDSATAFQIQNTGNNSVFTVNTSSNVVSLGKASTLTGKLAFYNSSGSNTITIQGPSINPGSSYTLTIPTLTGNDILCAQTLANCGGGSGVTTVGTIDSQTKSSNGAVISGSSIYLQTADASNPGIISTGTQTFAGAKTFTGAPIFKNTSDSTNGFQIQNAAGTSLFRADTSGANIIVENSTFQAQNIDIPTSSPSTISRTNRTSATSSMSFGTGSYTPAGTFSPGAGKLLVAYVNWQPSNVAMATDGSDLTISGGSLNWIPITGKFLKNGSSWGVGYRVFYAYTTASPPTNMQVTVDAGAFNISRYHVFVDEMSGVDPISPVAGAVSASRTSNNNDIYTADLARTPSSADWKILFGSLDQDSGIHEWDTPAGWTEISALKPSPDTTVMYQTSSTSTTLNYDMHNTFDYSNADTTYGGFILKAAGGNGLNIATGNASSVNIGNSSSQTIVDGSALFKNSTDSTTAFQVQNSSGLSILTGDTSGKKLQIGSSTTDSNAVLTILDSYNTTDPTGTNGAMYYSTSSNTFRCYENSLWKNCIDTPSNASTADQSIGASTTAYLTNSNINIPSSGLRAGSTFTWRVTMSKTAAGTAANTFDVRFGTNGTTSDTSRCSFTQGTQTGAIDTAVVDITVTVRSVSATGVIACNYRMTHNLSVTGFDNTLQTKTTNVTSGTFNNTTANSIIGLSYTTGASYAITVQQVQVTTTNL